MHIRLKCMSNSKLLIGVKDERQEGLSINLEVLKRPKLMFQNECHHENLSINSNSHKEDGNKKEEDYIHIRNIVLSKSKQYSKSEEDTASSREQHKVEDEEEKEEEEDEEEENDGFKTPTYNLDQKIQVAKQCPPAPRKPKPIISMKKRKPHYCHPLDLSKEVELLLLTTQQKTLSNSHQSTKKVRRE